MKSSWHVVGEVVVVGDMSLKAVRQLVEVVFADTTDEAGRLQHTAKHWWDEKSHLLYINRQMQGLKYHDILENIKISKISKVSLLFFYICWYFPENENFE